MRFKLVFLAVFALAMFSCGSKKTTGPVEPAAPVAAEATKDVAVGQSLYENNCGKCHKLYSPTQFSPSEWKPILLRMQKKAHLDDTQMASIEAYIHSKL